MSQGADDVGLPVEAPDLGDLDGRPFDRVVVKITAATSMTRVPADGETLLFTVKGTSKFAGAHRDKDGNLVRDHKLSIVAVAEPEGNLADEVSTWLVKLQEIDGQGSLGLDEGDEPGDPEE